MVNYKIRVLDHRMTGTHNTPSSRKEWIVSQQYHCPHSLHQ